ncbi:MAG: hypothetical protein ACO1RA_17470 [Planctomycetaceae bacterium]
MSEVWNLVQAERFAEACEVADRELLGGTENLQLILGNKKLALMALQRYDELLDVCDASIRNDLKIISGTSAIDHIFQGMAHWFSGRVEVALVSWQEARRAKYTDAAGGVGPEMLWYYAGLRCNNPKMQNEAIKKLQKMVKRREALNWPGSGAQFLLGEVSGEQLIGSLSENPIRRIRQLCQAAFYQGVVCLRDGDRQGFRDFMLESRSQGPVSRLEFEFYLASEKFCLNADGRPNGPPPLF